MNRTAVVFAGMILGWNVSSVQAQPGPCLYFQTNFQGEPMCIGRTQTLPNINGLGRGRIMSVNIPSDVRVTVCDQENLGGACYMLQGQVPDFGAIGPAGNASSLMATPANAANQPRPIQTPAPQQQAPQQQAPAPQQQGRYNPPPPTRSTPDSGTYTPPPPVRSGTVPLQQSQPAPSSPPPQQQSGGSQPAPASPSPQQQGGYQPPPMPMTPGGPPQQQGGYPMPPPLPMPPSYPPQQQGGNRPPRPLFPHQQQGAAPPAGMRPSSPMPPSYPPVQQQQTTAAPPPSMPNNSGRRPRREGTANPGAAPAASPSASPQTGDNEREERRALRKQCRNGDNDACARLGAMMSKRKERN